MSLAIRPLHRDDIPAWYSLAWENEPWVRDMIPTLAHFRSIVGGREGFVVENGTGPVAVVHFTDLIPVLDVMIHTVSDASMRGKWCSRALLREVFGYVFETLALERVSAYRVTGAAQAEVGTFLESLGFKPEGVKRHACLLSDGYHDVALYGMLKEECQWL